MSDRRPLPGKFVWFELLTRDIPGAQAFYGEVLGWKVRPFPMGDSSYEMIYVGDTMIGGYAAPGEREPARWVSCASVDDVDAAVRAAAASGGKVLEPAVDAPGVGRFAKIADQQGAELTLLKSATGDPSDSPPGPGGWLWNELHTTDPASAVAFYEKVLGLSPRPVDMGPSGTYYILARDGVDRGGVTDILSPGVPPHWLPYVEVEDADATLARAAGLGAKVLVGPHDIPGIGRFGILQDPTGGALAVMKSFPMSRPG
jgi:uncharacterized protein